MNPHDEFLFTVSNAQELEQLLRTGTRNCVRETFPGATEEEYAAAADAMYRIACDDQVNLECRNEQEFPRLLDALSPVTEPFDRVFETGQFSTARLEEFFATLWKWTQLHRQLHQELQAKLRANPGVAASADVRAYSNTATQTFTRQ